jgi:hypothetical protein
MSWASTPDQMDLVVVSSSTNQGAELRFGGAFEFSNTRLHFFAAGGGYGQNISMALGFNHSSFFDSFSRNRTAN